MGFDYIANLRNGLWRKNGNGHFSFFHGKNKDLYENEIKMKKGNKLIYGFWLYCKSKKWVVKRSGEWHFQLISWKKQENMKMKSRWKNGAN